MPTFIEADPNDVVIGEADPNDVVIGRARREAELLPYVEHMRSTQAGRIDLGHGETVARSKYLMMLAAARLGKRIRSSVVGRTIYWKVVGA